MTPQLQLFQPNFGNQIRRVEIGGVMFFSVLDIFKNYSEAANAARSWKIVEAFLIKQGAISAGWEERGYTQGVSLRMHKFEGKGQRSTPIGTFKMIMRIGQVTTFKEWEPMRDWMADLANERVEEAANPALGIHRAQDRFINAKVAQGMDQSQAAAFLQQVQDGRIKRNEWTEALKNAVIGAINYGQATNEEYRGLFQMTAKDIRETTGFQNARDGMTYEARAILSAVEFSLSRLFKQREQLTFQEALTIIRDVCAAYRVSVANVESMLGIELATGKPLITARS